MKDWLQLKKRNNKQQEQLTGRQKIDWSCERVTAGMKHCSYSVQHQSAAGNLPKEVGCGDCHDLLRPKTHHTDIGRTFLFTFWSTSPRIVLLVLISTLDARKTGWKTKTEPEPDTPNVITKVQFDEGHEIRWGKCFWKPSYICPLFHWP